MKRFVSGVFFVLIVFQLVAQMPATTMSVDGYYRLWGVIALHDRADFSAETVQYVTLNHEGGLPVKVLELGTAAVKDGQNGIWVRILTTRWAWAQNETRIPQYAKCWVFLSDDDIVQPLD